MTKRILLAVACLVFAAHTACQAQEARDLRLKFNKGDIYNYAIEVSGIGEMSMKTSESADMDMDSFELPMDISLYSEVEVQVVDTDAGDSAEMDIYLNRFRVNTGPGFMFDSADEEEGLPPFLEVLFDEPIILEMSPRGEIARAEFPQTDMEMNEAMAMLFPADMDPALLLKKSLFTLPDKPVAPGDKWTQTVSVPVPMSDNNEVTFTYNFEMQGYETVKGLDCAVVGVSVSDEFSTQLKQMEIPGFSGSGERVVMHFDRLFLDVSATLYFAWREGVFIGAEAMMQQDMRGTMTSSMEEEVIGLGMEFQADIKVELK